jgi:four helix bundle protein
VKGKSLLNEKFVKKNMGIEKFEDIIAWQKAKEMTILIYTNFKDSKDFGLKDQIQRAGVSVMNNIAEGFERKTNNEFKQFLYIAKGSCGEVRSMLYLVKELNTISESTFNKLYGLAEEISKILSGLIKTL